MRITKIITLSLIFTIFSMFFNAQNYRRNLSGSEPTITKAFLDSVNESRKWEAFIKALTWVESRHEPKAKNSNTSAKGIFQQLDTYVVEANRIVGYKKFKSKDRFEPQKAREMFDVVQSFYNPKKDIKKALKIHRGKHDKSHEKEVFKKMKEYLVENDLKSENLSDLFCK